MLKTLKYNILKENTCLSKSMLICLAGFIIFIKFMGQFQSNFVIFMALTHGQLTHQTTKRTPIKHSGECWLCSLMLKYCLTNLFHFLRGKSPGKECKCLYSTVRTFFVCRVSITFLYLEGLTVCILFLSLG